MYFSGKATSKTDNMGSNQHDEFRRNNFIKKLVSNSRAIISNQIAVPLGMQKMQAIINWIDQIEPINSIDLKVFQDYMSQTGSLPLGTERLAYHP